MVKEEETYSVLSRNHHSLNSRPSADIKMADVEEIFILTYVRSLNFRHQYYIKDFYLLLYLRKTMRRN